MTAMMATLSADAPPTKLLAWNAIDWQKAVAHVRQLQMRIAKAFREKKYRKVKALQWILTHSFYAKLLAVKRVVENKGAKTAGIDNILWNTPKRMMQAALSLKRHGYQTKPLKRIYIPKKHKGKLRPLSIPSMQCRGMQALHMLSLEPIAESIADKNAYGFRPLRSTADAIDQCFKSLCRRSSAQYVLEADISACFDKISHSWLLSNVLMDTEILRKWLAAGYMEKGKLYATDQGTPQGGIASPTLLVITLSGLEKAVKAATKPRDKVNVCIYADDFIITGISKEMLENKVKPIVETFLRERGLNLSEEKTKITHINEGFDFLGMNIRKYNNKLLIKPAKSSVKRFLADLRGTIKTNATSKTEDLIRILNQKIRGWANYYAHVCSKKTFNHVDNQVFKALWQWSKRRHPNKSASWIKAKYFRRKALQDWIFFAQIKNKEGLANPYDAVTASKIPIKRHTKIKADATPFDPAYHDYLNKRIIRLKGNKAKSEAKVSWWLGWWNLLKPMESDNRKDRVA